MAEVIDRLPPGSTAIHGGTPGLDTMAGEMALDRGLTVEEYAADWQRFGPAAGPRRNVEMVTKSRPDVAFAFPLGVSRGTQHCVYVLLAARVPMATYTTWRDWPASVGRLLSTLTSPPT